MLLHRLAAERGARDRTTAYVEADAPKVDPEEFFRAPRKPDAFSTRGATKRLPGALPTRSWLGADDTNAITYLRFALIDESPLSKERVP